MSEQNKTIEYYNSHAKEFCIATKDADMSFCYEKFKQYVKPRGKILDVGCGSGRDSKRFMEDGYQVEAIDASEKMCKYASEFTGQQVKCRRVEDITYEDEFDGIWACASLLHVGKKEIPAVLEKLCRVLRRNGILYVSFKLGSGERFADGRFFNDYREGEIIEIFSGQKGLEMKECFVTEDVRKEREKEYWVNIIAVRADKLLAQNEYLYQL